MKAKELIDWLSKVDPDTEIMCCGEGMNLYSRINMCDKSHIIGEVWMIGVNDHTLLVQDCFGFGNYEEESK